LHSEKSNSDLQSEKSNSDLQSENILMEEKRTYRRNLPHIQPEDGIFFITFRLDGSLPIEVIKKLQEERDLMIAQIKSKSDLKSDILRAHNIYFDKFDALLDNPSTGPTYLADKKIAAIVKDAIHFLDDKDYKLICYTIMSNHVHMINYKTRRVLHRILQSLKRFTGKEANKLLNRQGTFWQKESYDNLIRGREDLTNKIDYVLNNPVKAGLVDNWEDWEFSYCGEEFLEMLE